MALSSFSLVCNLLYCEYCVLPVMPVILRTTRGPWDRLARQPTTGPFHCPAPPFHCRSTTCFEPARAAIRICRASLDFVATRRNLDLVGPHVYIHRYRFSTSRNQRPPGSCRHSYELHFASATLCTRLSADGSGIRLPQGGTTDHGLGRTRMTSRQLIQQTGRPTARESGEQSGVPVRGEGPAGVLYAREAARAFAEGLSPVPDADAAECLVLVVSELVTNAVRHGGGRYTLALSASQDALTVVVGDSSSEVPRERTPDFDDGGGGFGWHMVRLLACEVTVFPGPRSGRGRRARSRGKTIRAVLPR
ncbi:ATP-binding protein [Streptomyces sp. NPDC054863]